MTKRAHSRSANFGCRYKTLKKAVGLSKVEFSYAQQFVPRPIRTEPTVWKDKDEGQGSSESDYEPAI